MLGWTVFALLALSLLAQLAWLRTVLRVRPRLGSDSRQPAEVGATPSEIPTDLDF